MALQLGTLRDALIEAGATPEKAREASEEVAGYENRLTRLTTLVQVALGLMVVLLGSQGALWAEIGHLNGQVQRMSAQVDQIARAVVR